MSSSLVPASFGKVSTKFASVPVENDLAAGIEASYFIMKYKGKVWTLSHKGVDTPLMRGDGSGPVFSIDVVIVKSAKVKSKIYYEGGYVDGSKDAPTCFSTNGVVPDTGAKQKQSASCAICPRNQWGSRTTDAGKRGKECGDSKRIAIVPADASQPNPACLLNAAYGGPGLLRVPAATLGALASYGDMMQQAGHPYFSIITRISFDPKEAYPTFTFAPVRPLTDDEADVIIEMANSNQVERILADAEVAAPAEPAPSNVVAFVQPLAGQNTTAAAQVGAPAPATATVAPPATVTVAPPQATTVAPQTTTNVPGFGAVATSATTAPPAQVTQQVTTVTPAADPQAFSAELDKLLAIP